MAHVCGRYSMRSPDYGQQFHAEHDTAAFSKKPSRQLRALLEKQIAQCDQAGAGLRAQDETLQKNAGRLDAIPGVGLVTAAAVRHDPVRKTCYRLWLAAGKKPLVAPTACLRKLTILMNRPPQKNPDFQLAR